MNVDFRCEPDESNQFKSPFLNSTLKNKSPQSFLAPKFDIQKVFEVKSVNKKTSLVDNSNKIGFDYNRKSAQRESVGQYSGPAFSKINSPTNNSSFLFEIQAKKSKSKGNKERILTLKSGEPLFKAERSVFRPKFASPKHNPFHKKSGSFSGTMNNNSISTKGYTPKSTRKPALPVGSTKITKSCFESSRMKIQVQPLKRQVSSKSPLTKYKEMMSAVYGLTNSQQNETESDCLDPRNKLSQTFDQKCEKISSHTAITDPYIQYAEPNALTSSSIDEVHLNPQSRPRSEVSTSKAIDRLCVSSHNKRSR